MTSRDELRKRALEYAKRVEENLRRRISTREQVTQQYRKRRERLYHIPSRYEIKEVAPLSKKDLEVELPGKDILYPSEKYKPKFYEITRKSGNIPHRVEVSQEYRHYSSGKTGNPYVNIGVAKFIYNHIRDIQNRNEDGWVGIDELWSQLIRYKLHGYTGSPFKLLARLKDCVEILSYPGVDAIEFDHERCKLRLAKDE